MVKTAIVLKSIFDNSDDVWFFVSPDYSILLFNKKAYQNSLVLHKRELKEGDCILDYVRDVKNNIDENFTRCFSDALKGNIIRHEQHIKYESVESWFVSKYIPVFIEEVLMGVSITVTDVTKEKQMEIERQRTHKEIEMLSAKKDEFLSIASHELKTPLTSMKAYNQLLEKIASEENIRQLVYKEKRQIDKLERLISDLLDVTRISSDHLQYRKNELDLITVIQQSIEAVTYISSKHQIHFTYSGEAKVYGDQTRLEQVIYNVLSNAIKYSPDGKKVDVQLEKNAEYGLIKIRDYGIGIPKDQIANIFERFFRVEQNDANKTSGLGLGLFISFQIVKEHQGSIQVESEVGKGTEFIISLPLINS